MSGSPCPTCRNPMRWIPAMQQWGCDTCRVMYPAQPVVQSFAMAMAPKKSNKGLVIGISVAAVVGAGTAITVIAMNHKKTSGGAEAGSTGSAGSSDEVAVASGSSAAAPIAPIKQVPLPPGPPPAPKDLTLGTPEPLELADMWLTPRKDGAFVVASSVFEAIFPHRPTAKVETAAQKLVGGKPYEIYTLSDDLQGRGMLQLQLMSLGRGGRDAGTLDTVKALVAKVGTVTESHRSDGGLDVTRYEASSAATGETMRVDARADVPRGMFAIATTTFIKSDQANAEAFLSSIHLRTSADPADDPKSLTIRVRSVHGKSEAHDAADTFVIDLPWAAKVARIPGGARVSVTAKKGKASVVLEVFEVAAWDALAVSPAQEKRLVEDAKAAFAKDKNTDVKIATEKLGGLTAARLDAKAGGHSYHTHLLWNRFQHRHYTLSCVDAPCDVVALSLKFTPPIPPR